MGLVIKYTQVCTVVKLYIPARSLNTHDLRPILLYPTTIGDWCRNPWIYDSSCSFAKNPAMRTTCPTWNGAILWTMMRRAHRFYISRCRRISSMSSSRTHLAILGHLFYGTFGRLRTTQQKKLCWCEENIFLGYSRICKQNDTYYSQRTCRV